MELWIGAGLACLGIAVAIGQWVIPPDKISPKIRTGLIALAFALALTGSGLLAYALLHRVEPVTTVESRNELNSSGTWRRLTDADRSRLSVTLSDGSRYRIRIFRTPTLDCMRLADDFYTVFAQLEWMQTHRPESPSEVEIRPGIHVATIPDNLPLGPVKNVKEKSGALLVVQALGDIGLPVTYETRGGNVDDLEIHLHIGVKPE
ncbi:MAG: hypothetical protein L0Z46_02725 [Nitrospiraceae bacterium]|nr:hypothetical protein [Nitrospiraceae bacterium]